jgi:hypothetical protein
VEIMQNCLLPFALGLLFFLGPVHSTPVERQEAKHVNAAQTVDIRSESDNCATNQPSVYICQN